MRPLFLFISIALFLTCKAQPCSDVEACMVVNQNNDGSFFFENCSTPTANSQFVWSFGDGTSENGEVVDHYYAQPGSYTVCLTMYWQNCVDSTCTTIVVDGANPCDDLNAEFFYSGGIQGV
ncbi:MAG: PKD domain-containing protein, partial [Flavobacteriales bacterium]